MSDIDGSATDTCRSCGAPIIWAVAERSLRSIPIDAAPAPGGNVELLPQPEGRPPFARSLRAADRIGKQGLRQAHFVTCPHADHHRRARRRGPWATGQ